MFVEKKNNAQRFVISDIHGCSKTLRKLVEEKVRPSKEDQIFFLGDYIDRGPDSAGVIDYIIELKEQGFNLLLLKGNHEENLTAAAREYDEETFRFFVKKINKSENLLDEKGRIKQRYLDFINQLSYFFQTDEHIIVHAGINFNVEKPFEDRISMLELRKTDPGKAKKFVGDKTVIHGHQVTPLRKIQRAIEQKLNVIPLDNGCYYTKPHKVYDVTQTGNLCCLNIDSYELFFQKNIDNS